MAKLIFKNVFAILQILFFFGVNTQSSQNSDIKNIFIENEVMPDLIAVTSIQLLQIKYNGVNVNPGDEISTLTALTSPSLSWSAESASLYTLIMADPDVPSRKTPILRSFLHWLVVNIPGDNVGKGRTVAKYLPPIPPEGTGFHRYVFLIYKQDSPISEKGLTQKIALFTKANGRVSFDINDFAEDFQLGEPKFGNFFKTEFSSIVNNGTENVPSISIV